MSDRQEEPIVDSLLRHLLNLQNLTGIEPSTIAEAQVEIAALRAQLAASEEARERLRKAILPFAGVDAEFIQTSDPKWLDGFLRNATAALASSTQGGDDG
jgi:transposase-like protein